MHVDSDDGVLEITFDRPDVRNAMDWAVAAELAETIDGADPEDHHAIVISGEGDAFSAGGDIEAMADSPGSPRESYEGVAETFGRVVEAMLSSPVPIVAKVRGDAVGAGLALVALADIAYADEGASFSCAFVRIGLIPDTGGTFVLPRIVGLRAAKKLAFTGEVFDAERAAELELVNEAVPAEVLDERVRETVELLERRPTDVIGMTKQALHENMARHWREALDYENALQVQARGSESHEEGIAAFLEGREPEFDE
ncbi:enoyl-CoA hydratase/isomerase family protein [Natronococcus jeotgali]|uniref:Enoyl-CoA hydratase/isomerase n=1 Tax=Natronococcus jeotgali DSM 18795 TaxID=1227498 RepID=L9WVT4_9EURY|nr:enoyl-CoA hydratase/isomerase family protein [Natronococcus jeotgali]ELY53609.1 enoyl-CoA hydratase/isomerase [Natronococcus jeotgali DSM 18795]